MSKPLITLPTREIFLTYCNPPVGGFALEKEPGKITNWDHCREQFAVRFLETTEGFYFNHKVFKTDDVISFMNKFENIIEKSETYYGVVKTEYALTNHEHIIYVKPSDFWKDCYYKRSLYTLLLRCGQNYCLKDDNFDDALFGPQHKESNYLIETKPAVLRFMFGFTKYTGICPVIGESTVLKHGWKEEFYKLDDLQIKSRLVLPDNVKKHVNIVGADSLWA